MTNPLNYLKSILAAVSASLYPAIDYLVGLIPNIPEGPRTSLDVIIVAILTGGVVARTNNQNQPTLTTGQVVVSEEDTRVGANIVAAHK